MADLSTYHERTRRRGVNTPVYWCVRAVLKPLMLVFFRVARLGRENVPASGPVILASNHRSFLDPFLIGVSVARPVYFVAKQELFEHRLVGWLLNALGAFPVRRGDSDEQSTATALEVLERGDPLVIFPEGTRVRAGGLGNPRRGVGRLALASGAPVVPIAVVGSERARRGWLPRPVRVRLRFGPPVTFPRVDSPSPRLATEVAARIWPCVALQWEWLGGLPALRRAAVVGGGSMGTALAALLARAGLEVQLGCRTAAGAAALREGGESAPPAARAALAEGVTVSTVAEIELASVDLVVLAVPSRSLPAAVGDVGARISDRSAVLVVSKGLVAPLATLPSRYVGDRVRARGVAALGGPAHADEAVQSGASLVVASADASLGTQILDLFRIAGVDAQLTSDVVGTELAGCAKNAAALAAAAVVPGNANAAGTVAASVFDEVRRYAIVAGASPQTFSGPAGIGDLIATVLAEGSRNRRAGELLGAGVPTAAIPELLGAVPEALDTVPLLAGLIEESGRDAPALHTLAALIEGRAAPERRASEPRAA